MLKSKFQTNITFAYTVYCILFTSANFLTQNVICTGIDSNFRLQYFLSLWSWVWAAERAKMTTLQNQCKCNLTSQKCTINNLCNLIKYLIFQPTCLKVLQTRNLRQTYINSQPTYIYV